MLLLIGSWCHKEQQKNLGKYMQSFQASKRATIKVFITFKILTFLLTEAKYTYVHWTENKTKALNVLISSQILHVYATKFMMNLRTDKIRVNSRYIFQHESEKNEKAWNLSAIKQILVTSFPALTGSAVISVYVAAVSLSPALVSCFLPCSVVSFFGHVSKLVRLSIANHLFGKR